jgi:hypothetical protein
MRRLAPPRFPITLWGGLFSCRGWVLLKEGKVLLRS